MKRRNVLLLSTILLILAMLLPALGEEKSLLNFTDTALKFSMQYPKGWKIDRDPAKLDRIYFVSMDDTTVIAVSVKPMEQKMTAKEFLEAIEQKMGIKNTLDDRERAFDEESCQVMNVEQGYCGTYVMKQEGKDVHALMNVFTRDRTIYFLMVSAMDREELDRLESVMASFKAL